MEQIPVIEQGCIEAGANFLDAHSFQMIIQSNSIDISNSIDNIIVSNDNFNNNCIISEISNYGENDTICTAC